MNDIFIYGGIGINVAGALFLMAYAIKYFYAFYKSRNNPIQTEAMKPTWAKRRAIGFGLIILGSIIAFIGCII
ncbi:unknown [Bacteroides sp. CAG:927]|nr:unknown [Bacteroides sp. CAG:927]